MKRVGNAEKEIEKRKNIYSTSKENNFTKGAKKQNYDFEELEKRVVKN